MSTAQPVSSRVFHDAFTHHDAATNDSLAESVKSGEVSDLPSGFSSINPNTVSPGTNGALSEGHSTEDGETVYFGGFKSDEGKFAATNSKGEVLFYFKASQEKAIIAHLKAAGLIPENVSSFSQLGDRAIGVIENAVDQGVLGVTESGQLEVVESPEDEAGAEAPSAGANRESDADENGDITGEERENSVASSGQPDVEEDPDDTAPNVEENPDDTAPNVEENPDDTAPEVGTESTSTDDPGAAAPDSDPDAEINSESNDVQESSTVSKSDLDVESSQPINGGGEVTVDADGNVYVSGTNFLESDQAVPVSQDALNQAGLGEDTSAEDVAKAFNEGRLGVVWPRDGSGNPTVLGASATVVEAINATGRFEAGPEMLDHAFSENVIGFTGTRAVFIDPNGQGAIPETVNPTNGWALEELPNGDYQLMNNRNGQKVSVTLTSEALSAAGLAGDEQGNFDEQQLRELMASGKLAVLTTGEGSPPDQVAVGLTDVQLNAIEEQTGMQGPAAVQEAYDRGLLGVNSGTGRVVVTDPQDPNKVIRFWDKEGQSTERKNADFAQFKSDPEDAVDESSPVPVPGQSYSIQANESGNGWVVKSDNPRYAPLEIPEAALNAVGLSSSSTAEEVAAKFADGALVMRNGEVQATIAEAVDPQGNAATVWDSNGGQIGSGYFVEFTNGDGNIPKGQIQIPEDVLVQAGLTDPDSRTAENVAQLIADGKIAYQSGDPSKPDDKGTWVFVGSVA